MLLFVYKIFHFKVFAEPVEHLNKLRIGVVAASVVLAIFLWRSPLRERVAHILFTEQESHFIRAWVISLFVFPDIDNHAAVIVVAILEHFLYGVKLFGVSGLQYIFLVQLPSNYTTCRLQYRAL